MPSPSREAELKWISQFSIPDNDDELLEVEKMCWPKNTDGDWPEGERSQYFLDYSVASSPEDFEFRARGFLLQPCYRWGEKADYWWFLSFPDAKLWMLYMSGELYEEDPPRGWEQIIDEDDLQDIADTASFCEVLLYYNKKLFRPEVRCLSLLEFEYARTIYSRGLKGLGI